MRARICTVLLLSTACVACGKPEPSTSAWSHPVEIIQVNANAPQLAPVSGGDSDSIVVDLKLTELREVQQLREQLQRELAEIRSRLESSNVQLQLKQQAVETIRTRLSQ